MVSVLSFDRLLTFVLAIFLLTGPLPLVTGSPAPPSPGIPDTYDGSQRASTSSIAGTGDDRAGSREVVVEDWKSANLNGRVDEVQVVDVDGDGSLEIVAFVSDLGKDVARIVSFDAATRKEEWRSADVAGAWTWWQVVQADNDAALEIVARTLDWNGSANLESVRVFDGTNGTAVFTKGPSADDSREHPRQPVLADVDADGILEIVDWLYDPAVARWRVTVDDIATGVRQWSGPQVTSSSFFKVANIDADANIEIGIANYAGGETIRFYDGKSFALQSTIGPWPNTFPDDWVIADTDKDGRSEVVYVEFDFATISCNMYQHDAQTGAQEWSVTGVECPLVDGLMVADVDDDGTREITAPITGPQFEVYSGKDGSRDFRSNIADSPERGMDIGDFDADGSTDLLVEALVGPGGNRLYLFDGPTYTLTWKMVGSYNDFRNMPPDSAAEGLAAWSRDWDADGTRELLVRVRDSVARTDYVELLTATNGSTEWKSNSLGYAGPRHTAAGDINGSGRWAVVAAGTDSGTGNGPVTAWDPVTGAQMWTTADIDSTGVSTVDVAGDRRPEILAWGFTASTGAGHLYLYHVDLAPVLLPPIPDLFLAEDTDLPQALVLSDHFSDDWDANLTYAIQFQEDNTKVTATVVGDVLALDTMTQDWFGVVSFRVSAADSRNPPTVSNTFRVTVTPVNDAPVAAPVGPQSLTEGVAFSLTLAATDVDGDALAWAGDNAKIRVDAGGTVAWTPTNDDIGGHEVTATVRDGQGGSATVLVAMTVANVNQPPVLSLPDGPLSATEGVALAHQIVATDPDLRWGDTLTYSTDSTSAAIDPSTGMLALTPTNAQVGTLSVHITVTDSAGAADDGYVLIQVANVNAGPVFVVGLAGELRVPEDEPVVLEVLAADEDTGDTLVFIDDTELFDIEAVGAGKGRIAFTPTNEQVGSWAVTVVVTDASGARAETTGTIVVENVNDPPLLGVVADHKATEDRALAIHLTITDPDLPHGDVLTATVDPAWLALDLGTGLLTGTPTNDEVGSHTTTVTVSDASGAKSRATFVLVVTNTNDPPKILEVTGPQVSPSGEQRTVRASVRAMDPDRRDTLAYRWFEGRRELGSTPELATQLGPGRHTLSIIVTDAAGASDRRDLTVDIPRPPVLIPGPERSAGAFGPSPLLLLLIVAVVAGIAVAAVLGRRRGKGPTTGLAPVPPVLPIAPVSVPLGPPSPPPASPLPPPGPWGQSPFPPSMMLAYPPPPPPWMVGPGAPPMAFAIPPPPGP